MCPQIFDNFIEVPLLRSYTCNTKDSSCEVLHDKRRLDRDQIEGDSAEDSRNTLDVQNEGRLKKGDPSIVIKTREIRHTLEEESDPRVVSKIDLILHSNTNITEAS